VQAVAANSGEPETLITPGNAFAFGLSVSLLTGLISVTASALASGSLVYAVLDLQRAGAASTRESLGRGLRALPKLFLINFMYMAVVGVGYVLLIVPGVIFSLMYALVVPVALAEGRGPLESFKRSSELTSGYRGLIFLTYFLWGLAVVVLNLIIGGSFAYGGPRDSLAVLMAQAFAGGILTSTTAVLTVYIYLGLLHERGRGFDAPDPYAAR
jgi:hypothetical protein